MPVKVPALLWVTLLATIDMGLLAILIDVVTKFVL